MKKCLFIIILTISTIVSTSFKCYGQLWEKHEDIQGQYTLEQCPKCGSTHIKIAEKSFNGWAALGGAFLLGPLGLAAGTINMGDVKFICTKCGFDFDPSDIKWWNRRLEDGEVRFDLKTPKQLKEIREIQNNN